LGERWLDYFDLVICGARKPGFLLDPYLPIFRVRTEDDTLQNIEIGTDALAAKALAEGKVFQGGNWMQLHRMLKLSTGSALMYVGDHMYSDILRSKRTLGWRTVLIMPELRQEVRLLVRSEEERRTLEQMRIARARADLGIRQIHLRRLELFANAAAASPADGDPFPQLDAEEDRLHDELNRLKQEISATVEARHLTFHPIWGQIFKAGHQNSRWAQQVQDYACLYTSRATNLYLATGSARFSTRADLMPHDRACIEVAQEKEREKAVEKETPSQDSS
jgi:hypothetical protein